MPTKLYLWTFNFDSSRLDMSPNIILLLIFSPTIGNVKAILRSQAVQEQKDWIWLQESPVEGECGGQKGRATLAGLRVTPPSPPRAGAAPGPRRPQPAAFLRQHGRFRGESSASLPLLLAHTSALNMEHF